MQYLRFYRRTLLFVLLSLGDLLLTWWLLEHSGRVVCEANPIADWWLERFGWLGLAGFKASMVLFVIVLTSVISRHRPHAARRILGFGCTILALVALHGFALRQTAETPDEWIARVNKDQEEHNREARRRTSMLYYRILLADVTHDLTAGKFTLSQAVDKALHLLRGEDPNFLDIVARRHPGYSLRESLAIEITNHEADARVASSKKRKPPRLSALPQLGSRSAMIPPIRAAAVQTFRV